MPDYKNLFDEQLIDLLRDADHGAFQSIYERYFSILYIFTYKRLHDEELSKDLLQELFTNLWIQRESIDPAGSLSGYLYRSVRNRIVNHYRQHGMQQKYIDSLQDFAEAGGAPADYLVREKQLAAKIELEIHSLPEKLKQVFLLSRKQYLTYQEISVKLGIPKESVKTYGKNALKILRVRLGALFSIVSSFF